MKNVPSPPSAPPTDTADTLAAIGPVARSSVVDAVATRLQNEILAGRIAAGSRLPSERELSLALGVNRLTLRAALARLEAQGLVATRHGAGTIVASWRERAGLDALTTLIGSLTPWEPTWRELLESMLELRRVLASEGVALAASRHTAADLDTMLAIAAQQKERVGDAIVFARGDVAFQRAVVHAGRNIGLELVLNTFARLPEEFPDLTAALYDRREESLGFYDACVALIQTGDEDRARATVREALEAVDAAWYARNAPTGGKSKIEAKHDGKKPKRAPARKGRGRDGGER
jgi:GntR family transcriptional repressor for pyruvate dehydrogenase complex